MSNTIYELTQRLAKSLDSDYNVIDMDAVLEIITTLEITKITREQLEITRLAKFINQLRRKTGNESLARRSKNLLKKWREMVMPDLVPNASGASGTKIKITNGRVHPAASNNNQRLPNHNNNNNDGVGGDCDPSNTATTTLLIMVQKNVSIPATEKSATRNNDNSLLSNDDTNCSNNSSYFTQESGIPLLNGLKSIFNTDESQTSVEKFVASNKVRNKGRGKLNAKNQKACTALTPSSSANLFIYHDSLSNSESVSHFNSNSNKQNTTSIPNTINILNQESDLTFKNKITPPNYLIQNNSKTNTDTVIIDSSSDDDHDTRKLLINSKSLVVSPENSRSKVVSPPTAVQNHIQKMEPIPVEVAPPIPPVLTPPAPKRRGRKKGSKGCDYELATLGGFNNMSAHHTGTLGNPGATSSIMSDIRHKLTSFSGGTTKKIKTTKELLAEIQSKKLGSSATSSPILPTPVAQILKSSPPGCSEDQDTPLQLSPPDSTSTTVTANSTLNLDSNNADINLSASDGPSSSVKLKNNTNDDALSTSNNINNNNNDSNDDKVLDSSKKLFKNIDDEILYLGEQLPKLEKCAINWTDDDDLLPCTCQLKLVIDNSSNISSSTCNNNNNNSDNINNNNNNNNNNDLLHTSNDLTVILTNNSSKVSNDGVVNDRSGGNLQQNHQAASISIAIDKNPGFLNNNNNSNNNNNVSTKKPIKSIFDVDYDDEIDNNGDNNSSSKHEYYINNLNNSDNISNSNYNISVPIGKTKLLSIDVPPSSPSLLPPPPSNLQNLPTNSVDPSHNENSNHDNLLQEGQDSLLLNNEQWTVDEDPNCKAKQFYEINKSMVKDYHINRLHNYFINNVNGNWDNFQKADIPNLNDYEYLKDSTDIASYINSDVVPKYNHIDNNRIRKNWLHVKFNHKKSKKLTKKRIKKIKKSDDDKPNDIITQPIVTKSEVILEKEENAMVVVEESPINCKNIKKRLHSSSSSSSSSSAFGSKNSTSSDEAGDSSSSSSDEVDRETNGLLPSFDNITENNLTGVNSDGCMFKEWHEIVHVKSYNDEPLTILPYVVID